MIISEKYKFVTGWQELLELLATHFEIYIYI